MATSDKYKNADKPWQFSLIKISYGPPQFLPLNIPVNDPRYAKYNEKHAELIYKFYGTTTLLPSY